MTLRLLLSHRAGFTHEAPVGNNFSAEPASFEAHLASIPATWLRFPVGERTAYSNLGVDLAGQVLQAAPGSAYADAVRARVLEPAGMRRSRFATEALRAEPNRALGRTGDVEPPLVIPIQASGGLYSSANDLARFLRIALDHGAPLVSLESWAEMQQIAHPVSEVQSRGLGLGLFVNLRDGRVWSAGHDGGGYGFQSHLAWFPALGVGLAILQNSSNSSALSAQIAQLLEKTARRLSGSTPFRPEGVLPAPPPCREPHESERSSALGAYTGRGSNAMLVEGEPTGFGVLGTSFQPLCFVDDALVIHREKGMGDAWRLLRSRDGRPERLLGLNSGTAYEYNDGPGDPPGPGVPEWREYLGTWKAALWDTVPVYLPFYEQNGWLYFDDLRLTEFAPSLFFASNGEVLDLTRDPPTWRSVPIRKHEAHPIDGARAAQEPAQAREPANGIPPDGPAPRSWWLLHPR